MSTCVRECGTEVKDVFLCRGCTDRLVCDLRSVEWLAVELDTTITRQHRFGGLSGSVARSAEKPVPFHLGASDTAAELKSGLVSWCRVFAEPVGAEPLPLDATIWAAGGWLLDHVQAIRAREESGEAAEDVEQLVTRARNVVDRPPDRWYAGPCGECDRDLYATATRGEIACECGELYDVETRRGELLAAIEDQLVPTSDLCRALGSLGRELRSEQVRQWVARGKLTQLPAHPADPHNRPRYRVGDVVDLLAAQAR